MKLNLPERILSRIFGYKMKNFFIMREHKKLMGSLLYQPEYFWGTVTFNEKNEVVLSEEDSFGVGSCKGAIDLTGNFETRTIAELNK